MIWNFKKFPLNFKFKYRTHHHKFIIKRAEKIFHVHYKIHIEINCLFVSSYSLRPAMPEPLKNYERYGNFLLHRLRRTRQQKAVKLKLHSIHGCKKFFLFFNLLFSFFAHITKRQKKRAWSIDSANT